MPEKTARLNLHNSLTLGGWKSFTLCSENPKVYQRIPAEKSGSFSHQ